MECEVWSVKFEKCGARSVGMCSAECGVKSVKCGVRSVECAV